MLTPDAAHNAAFTNMQIISFKNGMNLKDHLVWAVLLRVDVEGIYKPCRARGGNVLLRYVNQYMILPILKGETPMRCLIC